MISPHICLHYGIKTTPQNVYDDFERAIEHRFEQTYYTQLYNWCETHNIALTGHPSEPDATRHLRYFHIPGQDIVWRQLEPNKPSALEGRQSTQGKAASSMMLHTNRRRNANEFCGAYGHDFTFDEMQWLAHWLLIRGCNLLIPHAFYYSTRGPRLYERPPDVGMHSAWWDNEFTNFAHACRRLSWLNTDSDHICHVAILGEHHRLPWRAAKACFQNQIDFNYLDIDDFISNCEVNNKTLQIANQTYHVLIVDGQFPQNAQRVLYENTEQLNIVYWTDNSEVCINKLKGLIPSSPFEDIDAVGLRVRHVRKQNLDWYIVFNEEDTVIDLAFNLENFWILNPKTDGIEIFSGRLYLEKYDLLVLVKVNTKD